MSMHMFLRQGEQCECGHTFSIVFTFGKWLTFSEALQIYIGSRSYNVIQVRK